MFLGFGLESVPSSCKYPQITTNNLIFGEDNNQLEMVTIKAFLP